MLTSIIAYACLQILYVYCIVVFSIFGVQSSISQTHYTLGKYNWIFYFVTIIYAVSGFMVYNHTLTFLMMAALAFCITAPAFRSGGMETMVHYIGANIAMLLAQVFITYVLGYYTITILTLFVLLLLEYLPGFIPKLVIHNKTTWIELIIYTSINIAYFIYLF